MPEAALFFSEYSFAEIPFFIYPKLKTEYSLLALGIETSLDNEIIQKYHTSFPHYEENGLDDKQIKELESHFSVRHPRIHRYILNSILQDDFQQYEFWAQHVFIDHFYFWCPEGDGNWDTLELALLGGEELSDSLEKRLAIQMDEIKHQHFAPNHYSELRFGFWDCNDDAVLNWDLEYMRCKKVRFQRVIQKALLALSQKSGFIYLTPQDWSDKEFEPIEQIQKLIQRLQNGEYRQAQELFSDLSFLAERAYCLVFNPSILSKRPETQSLWSAAQTLKNQNLFLSEEKNECLFLSQRPENNHCLNQLFWWFDEEAFLKAQAEYQAR